MSESVRPHAPEPTQPKLGDLVEDALHQAKTLVQAELSLARREFMTEVASTFDSLIWLAFGALFAQAALTTLGVLAVLALGVSVASFAVVVVLAAVSTALLSVGVRALKQRSLPNVTQRLAMDAKQVMETAK
ncbi:MAG: phage holin family protein [Polyangiaceae bacterium]